MPVHFIILWGVQICLCQSVLAIMTRLWSWFIIKSIPKNLCQNFMPGRYYHLLFYCFSGDFARAVRANGAMKLGIYHSLYEWFNQLYLMDKTNNFTTRFFSMVYYPKHVVYSLCLSGDIMSQDVLDICSCYSKWGCFMWRFKLRMFTLCPLTHWFW